ncbi:hypothetical protein GCM10009779_70140 [Polymorphospora rubra]|uniref:Uncharacterized protein n=1 Tax=Polymorphospora rubra TaxID=338584 RepID=A0A810NDQ0_9ACTN|nr:hypothetical protein Prubr_64360 [Polymorphospora rubra]
MPAGVAAASCPAVNRRASAASASDVRIATASVSSRPSLALPVELWSVFREAGHAGVAAGARLLLPDARFGWG